MSAGVAVAQEHDPIRIAPQSLTTALQEFGRKTSRQVMFTPALISSKVSAGVSGATDEQIALAQLLQGTGLTYRQEGDIYMIVQAGEGSSGPQGASAGDVDALIVTAQKREENIQDVPIAMSAFSQEALEKGQIAGGPDLITQVPNMTFTKTNFSGYSIQIRGIGTQAISATTDPAVAVAFNNTPFIRNRFFEQEFYDLQRVEVLRGPQGTLYGRNATAGVVNIISAKPKFNFEAKASGDLGNYKSKRLEGMVNIPLVEDVFALRLAGAWTKREGYATNELTGNPIDGRDLWSSRLSLRFAPTDDLDVNLIWEHFQEDDDRIRSGKQLCKKDTRSDVAGVPIPIDSLSGVNSSPAATYNQGCVASSLYSADSFQTPNGFALPYYHPLRQLGLPTVVGLDPYASTGQSEDLRVVESVVDPQYRAKSDIAELQISWDISDNISFQSETAYSTDEVFSTQDYNRFNTAHGAFSQNEYNGFVAIKQFAAGVLNDGVYCDPQIGCSDRLVAVDLSTAQSTNFSQEFRISSDYDGPLNFSFGTNFTRYDTEDKYYVFINTLGLWAALRRDANNDTATYVPGVTDNSDCLNHPWAGNSSLVYGVTGCIYTDPNPIGALNDKGHNYFLSRNPYRLISYAGFGEVYFNLTDALKFTGGLRYTVDRKHSPMIPSWLIASDSVGYPVKEILDLEWREPSGRFAVDWKPNLAFTDETLLYGSYAHGYKAGGTNPPPMVVVMVAAQDNATLAQSVLHPQTFDAEFVDAFEVGAKNTLLDGRLTFNTSAFYYDYKGYQISEIVDRSAVNSNYDAEVWGAEIEADWRPIENLRLGFKGGYEKTHIADGTMAVDLMDRTAGDPNWVVAKPFPALASNCILPVSVVTFGNRINTLLTGQELGDVGYCVKAYILGNDPVTNLPYVPNPTRAAQIGSGTQALPARWAGYQGFNPDTAPNGGAGISKDLSGNELPNAPHFTGTLTADYTFPSHGDWLANVHADLYYQSEAWLRVFNTEGYDKLKAYTTLNLAATFTNEDAGLKVMLYMKNVMDRDSITGAFLNSDDSGLTTNVFLTEPRLFGVRVTKDFTGGSLLGAFGGRQEGPYRFELELGGQALRLDAPYETIEPSFASAFAATLDPLASQHRDLDWGDGREAKLTYRPLPDWTISLGGRFGETNNSATSSKHEVADTECNLIAGATACAALPPSSPNFVDAENYVDTATVSGEDHTIVDLMVGRDIGIGSLWGRQFTSKASAGVRYAQLNSRTDVQIAGIPDWDLPDFEWVKYAGVSVGVPAHHTAYDADVVADREFEGVGPVLSWDASLALLGDEDIGHLDADVSISGGALFGRQHTQITGEETASQYSATFTVGLWPLVPTATATTPIALDRSKSVTVPVLGLGMGLSYKVDRMSLGAGYHWERYFDAVDGGYAAYERYDRTIQGPYIKLSIGFGG